MIIFLLITTAVSTFFVGALRGANSSQQAAFGGQAAELAMTHLRTELAGAMNVQEGVNSTIIYTRVRDNDPWTIEVEDKVLRRRNIDNGDVVVFARNIDSFDFELVENTYQIAVTVNSGKVTLEERIFMRNMRYNQ